MRRLITLGMLLVTLAVAGPMACGKRGELEPPKGEKSQYPRSYPSS